MRWLLLGLTVVAASAADHRHFLASQYSWGQQTGFWLCLENQFDHPPGATTTLKLTVGAGDGQQWRFLTPRPAWRFDHDYRVKVVYRPDSTELLLDDEPLGRLAGGFTPHPAPLLLNDVPSWAGAPVNYLVIPLAVRVTAGRQTITRSYPPPPPERLALTLFGDAGAPTQTLAFTAEPTLTIEASFRLAAKPELKALAPLIDPWGQCRYADFPGRITGVEDLRRAAVEEDRRLAEWGRPGQFDRYGGRVDLGWRSRATGFYRLEQRGGWWWLITPEGNPCFYTGIGTAPALTWDMTPVTGREYLFEWLPERGGDYAPAWGTNPWGSDPGVAYFAPHTANMIRRDGAGWAALAEERTRRRVAGWAFSGLGKWGGLDGLPRSPVLRRGGVPKLVEHPDPFDPATLARLRDALAEQIEPRKNDPFILGWSIGNEFDEIITTKEIQAVMALGDVPAKRALVDYAAKAYTRGDPTALARLWQVEPATPEALYRAILRPDAPQTETLRRYYAAVYYKVLEETVKAIDPNHLYFGFWIVPGWWENEADWKLIAQHCDALGYDRYSHDFADERLQRLIDDSPAPVLCGEFGFPATYDGTRGFGRYGTHVSTDADSGDAYAAWVATAAREPKCVGVMWFQYRDQPLTGRGPGHADRLVLGEHYAFGLVDIGDRPKWDLVERVRAANLTAARLRQDAAR